MVGYVKYLQFRQFDGAQMELNSNQRKNRGRSSSSAKKFLSADQITAKFRVMNLTTLIGYMGTDTRCENIGARKGQYVYWLKYVYWQKLQCLESRTARFETNLNGEMI